MSAKTGEQGEKEKEREFEEEEDFQNENESDEGDGIDNFFRAALQHPKDRQVKKTRKEEIKEKKKFFSFFFK